MTFGPNLVWWHHLLFQVLDLHDNQLASLPADIGQLTALQVKDLQLHPRCLYRAWNKKGGKEQEKSRRSQAWFCSPAWCSPGGSRGHADALSKQSPADLPRH